MTIDSMFPLLQLPYLCIQEVSDQWNVSELYYYSLLSKRAKRISKRMKETGLKMDLYLRKRSLYIRKYDDCDCEFFFARNPFQVDLGVSPDISSFFQATQHFLDVFNFYFRRIDFKFKPPITEDQLIMIIDWLNGVKTEIGSVRIQSANLAMTELFMNRFQKNIQVFRESSFFDPVHKHYSIVSNRLNFKVEYLIKSNNICLNLEFLLSIDCERINTHSSNLNAKDLNIFLRSWQEGKTNQNLIRINLTACSEIDMKEVLKDCGAELVDPRTAKLKLNNWWINGGIHIRRNDGRLAVIQNSTSFYISEDWPTTTEEIETYLKNQELWNSTNEKWFEKNFNIYTF
uniref:FBA_2 domain-containing protein n=1 Tax=Caenorhabditis tropicalis TaxID=1561998 RepID=A0A1I7U1B4_9PELO